MDDALRARIEILEELDKNEGAWVSGAELAERLGRSRTAVSNHVSELRSLGYDIDSQSSKGYRLEHVPDIVHPVEIWRCLGEDDGRPEFPAEIHYFDETDSTSTQAAKMAEAGAPHGTMVIAESQSAGRGRLGRSWVSRQGEGLYFSIILRPEIEIHRIPQLTLLAAVVLARTFEEVCAARPQIKWPNDILIHNKKCCGILTEMAGDADRARWVILGIGINVSGTEFPPEIADIATSLKLALPEPPPHRAVLLAHLLDELERALIDYEARGLEWVRKSWEEYAGIRGKRVRVSAPGGERREGIARGLDQDGALLLETEPGATERIIAGDVTLL